MARYTETFLEYLQNGNKLPVVFEQIPGFNELFLTKFMDHEIGFETEELFKLKLEGLANILIPLYSDRLDMYQTTLDKAKNPIKTYEDVSENTINGGEREGSSTEVPIDISAADPTMLSKQEAFIDKTNSRNVRTENGMTVAENYMVLDKLTEKVKSIKETLLKEFDILFMKVYF